MTATLDDEVAELRRVNAELQRELDEAIARESAMAAVLKESLEYQTATSDVLQVISRSTFDLQPVLDTLVDTVARLCEADNAIIFQLREGRFHMATSVGFSPEFREHHAKSPTLPGRGTVTGRVAVEHRVVHIEDAAADPEYTATQSQQLGQTRTMLGVPLLREDKVTGVITLSRLRVEPFTDKQIELVTTFADQAVIAIENARLLTETREALEQQTATAEVLQVINSSPGNLAPVFDAILEKAHTLCGVATGSLQIYDGEKFRAVATHALPERLASLLRQGYQPHPEFRRRLETEGFVHIADVAEVDHSAARMTVEFSGIRTTLHVALRKDNALLGQIVAARQEVRPFAETEIGLLQNFAAQAVIALENARLVTETREALEQQTATVEVLQVINASPGDLKPVFEAMLEKAMRLCEAAFGFMTVIDGERSRTVAARGVPGAYAEFRERNPTPANAPIASRVRRGEPFIHTVDLKAERFYGEGDPQRRAIVDLGGARTLLAVPLMRDQAVLGAIQVYRSEVRPFSDKQIALMQNFAAQAVIAMENARLITETREALEQQTATAEVLGVINSSPGDLKPVFQAILQKAHALCKASFGALMTYDGERFYPVAHQGTPAPFREFIARGIQPRPGDPFGRMVEEAPLSHIHDLLEVAKQYPTEPLPRAAVDLGGIRTLLVVPLRKDATLLGAITAYRQDVNPFSDTQIALLKNFAAQAVIAMEAARLLTETREALEQQTATAEVLQVINSSPGDLVPVFDALLEKGVRLSEAAFGVLCTFDGERFRPAAMHGVPGPYAEHLSRRPLTFAPGSGPAGVLAGQRYHMVADFVTDPLTLSGDPARRALVELGGARTGLAVPLRKDAALVGMFLLFRQEVQPFSDKQIALLQNFAAQAVIAMENARLITETREALEQQTATAEVLQVINSSPGDLAPVFEAMLEKAIRLCDGAQGTLWMFDGERMRASATAGYSSELAESLREWREIHPFQRRLAQGERVFQILDLAAEVYYRLGNPLTKAAVDVGGIRTVAFVALVKDAITIGGFTIGRREVRAFTDKQIALLQSFAAQAVIAVENARLITETREALEQQTATAEVLQVINSSPGDLSPVFDAMLEKAMRLCEAAFGFLSTYDGEYFHAVALRGVPQNFAEGWLSSPYRSGPNTTHDRLIRGERLVHVPDLAADGVDDPRRRAVLEVAGVRSILGVPLRKEGVLLGAIHIYRQEVRPFTDKQIALAENFAAQAVIAMENARLLDEIRQRQHELRVTFDNMVDGVAMFDETLHLAAWNRNFQEFLQLPDEFLAQRHDFDTYIRYLTDRGEFGETDPERQIKRLRARIGDHYSFERTRPDGTVIEVRNNPMPDGGIVVIYSDITERKRSEAEIRAARDAAEAAYRDLKAAQASLIQAEKMASLGQLTAGIAHEIKNPLNFVNNFADLSVELLDELKETAAPAIAALRDDKRAEIDETIGMLTGNLEKIAEHGRRADGIVKSMLEHSRGSSGERRSVDFNGLIEEALNLAYHGARAQDASFNITLERDFAESIAPIELVPQDITRVCLNLIGNGFYAATKRQREEGDSNFKPTLKVSTRDLGEAIEVQVRDNGIGIAPEIKDKLFQPFFTTKPTGEGTGLGLSISYDIVTQQHGGTITVDSEVGDFTEFTIRLPRTHQTTMAEAAS